jgi:NADH dehydrogenase
MSTSSSAHVVVIGGGFAGLNATKALAKSPVTVTLIDQRNHHVFQPLLYQVATASLSPADIAAPIRAILRRQENVRVILAEVTGIDTVTETVLLEDGTSIGYDHLILAAGATHSYFGHDDWAPLARGLKDLDDAVAIRNQILLAFEAAERATSDAERERNLTFAIVGGGPTGVELAGAIAEIAKHSIARDFDTIDPTQAKILLIEAAPRTLLAFPDDLAASAQRDLEHLGVVIRVNSMVTEIDRDGVTLASGETIPAATVLWAAGVQANPLGKHLGVETDRAGRVLVTPELNLKSATNVWVVGDLATLNGPDGKPYPGVAQVAIQQGKWAAANIGRSLAGEALVPFRYKDRGNMATIGRNRAIAVVFGLRLKGFLAWIAWLFIHLINLIGFRNRVIVMSHWVWGYLTFHRRVRLITGPGRRVD